MTETPDTDELTITGAETADHTVPADVLARTLAGLQRIVYLMAASARDQPIGDRFTPSDDLRRQHTLRCGIPRASSFDVPLLSAPKSPSLFPDLIESNPLADAFEVLRIAAERRWSELNARFSRPKYLGRVLMELQGMLPRSGERWGLGLRVGGSRVNLDASTSRSLGSYLSSTAAEDATMTVTGELLRVNIEDHRLVIRYPPTRTEIPCHCDDSVFGTVMRNYDVPIQVTGLYTLDRKGHPVGLTGVTHVEPIDLSPLTFTRVEWAGRTFDFKDPLALTPTMDEESGQFYVLNDSELNLDVFARTRHELADELAEQVCFQWDTYAMESPERLSRCARRLRDALLTRIREVELATPSEEN